MTPSSRPLIALAAGGTGGHVFPALAVAEALRTRGVDTMLLTDRRGARLMGAAPHRVLPAASPFQRGMLRRGRAMVQLAAGLAMTVTMMLRRRPAAVVGFGGYPSFAPLLGARLTGVPAMLHEQNAYLGRANHMLARWCGHLALSWPGTRNLPERVTSFVSGMPVRSSFFAATPGNTGSGDRLCLTIIGGSLGAAIFADLVPDAVSRLDDHLRRRLRIVQQCRAEQHDGLAARYQDIGVDAEIRPFFDDMPARLAASHLVISRAGASSVAELAAAGRAAILIPFAGAMDDHQTANARQLDSAGGGRCLAESGLDAAGLATVLAEMLTDPKRLSEMGTQGRGLAAPDAADDIAAYALRLAGGTINKTDKAGSRI
ncbi:MAG: UDP-N-acetylglucosamine--N-acetylmuramyl-(pentapeptide) pyrophosphoryl-undecaprenol N-acetylglucosamine transferase [Candidatus Puniceispirillaceae bacterium]